MTLKFQCLGTQDSVLWESMMLSLALHGWILYAGHFSTRSYSPAPVEVDITSAGPPGENSGDPVKHIPRPKSLGVPAAVAPPIVSPLPGESVTMAPAPAPLISQSVFLPSAETVADDVTQRATLSRLPRLLNLGDLASILRRFYPEAARANFRQATVILDLHIDLDGHVTSADVVRSGGSDFDAAALKVAMLLRFTPAVVGHQVVAVKMRQAIQFKLS